MAAEWLLSEAEAIAALAKGTRPDLDVAVVREQVSGAIPSQRVFGYEISNVYNNLTNVILYIRPMFSNESYLGNLGDATEGLGMRTKEVHDMSKGPKAVLVNAHFDSPLGSPGASDCASCVAVALEIARTIVANASLHLSTPLVVLFNGGEETLMQASHGFMASSAYSKDLGAFINLESTGAWGECSVGISELFLLLVCQPIALVLHCNLLASSGSLNIGFVLALASLFVSHTHTHTHTHMFFVIFIYLFQVQISYFSIVETGRFKHMLKQHRSLGETLWGRTFLILV